MSHQTVGGNVHRSPILSLRPEMGENMIDSLVHKVFTHFRFLEIVTISSVKYIKSHKFVHSVTLMGREYIPSLFCLFRSYLDTTLLVNEDKN